MAPARKYSVPWDLMVLTNESLVIDLSNLVRRLLGVPSKFNSWLNYYNVLIVKHTAGQFWSEFFWAYKAAGRKDEKKQKFFILQIWDYGTLSKIIPSSVAEAHITHILPAVTHFYKTWKCWFITLHHSKSFFQIILWYLNCFYYVSVFALRPGWGIRLFSFLLM